MTMTTNSPDIFEYLLQLFFILIFLGCGVGLIYGTLKKWPMLVAPPRENVDLLFSFAI